MEVGHLGVVEEESSILEVEDQVLVSAWDT